MDRRKFVCGCSALTATASLPILPFASSALAEPVTPRVCTEIEIDNLDLAFSIAINEFSENDPRQNRTKAAALTRKKWNPKRRYLDVDFVEEPAYLNTVIAKARLWEAYLPFSFRFGRGEPEVLIAFDPGGSWSSVGTDSTYYASRGIPSMNYGWFDEQTADLEYERTTVHEFGHALGLIHEHLHPQVDIPWDKPKVYAYYKKLGWDETKVDQNIFQKYGSSQLNYTQYDPDSIMHYPIPAELLMDPSFAVGWNTKLTHLDATFMKRFYETKRNQLPG